jgi:hypothetical protein
MAKFQTRQNGSWLGQPAPRRGPFPQAYPGKGKPLKAAKNNPGVLQRYVTYDTLQTGELQLFPFCPELMISNSRRKALQ